MNWWIVIHICTNIHHHTGYFSTFYRLTRNLALHRFITLLGTLMSLENSIVCCLTWQTKHFLAMHCFLLSLFFLKRNNFSQNHFHFLSLDIQKIFLRCNLLSLSLPYVGIRPDCPAWEQLSSVFGLVLRKKEASLSSERLSFNQPGRWVICPCDEAGSGKSRHCSFWKAASICICISVFVNIDCVGQILNRRSQ